MRILAVKMAMGLVGKVSSVDHVGKTIIGLAEST